MYHAHWGLSRSPFAGGEAPLFYRGESQAEALARLRYVVGQRRHAVLVGERGVGKSLLLQQFAAERRPHESATAVINVAGLSPRELLWHIAAGISISPRLEDESVRLFRRLEDFAAAASWRTSPAVLLLDDADQAGADVRLQLVRLLSLGQASCRWLTLVLSTTPRGTQRLGEDLLEAIDLRIELEPWTEGDMIGYLQHALIEAGGDRPIFDDEALSAMHGLTGGIARKVNRLADHALLGAAAEGREMVDAAMIESAYDALSWTAAGSA
jgi:general secretion pathway protein A